MTQIHEMRILFPVKVQNWRCRSRSQSSKGNSDDRLAWAYTGGMTSGYKWLSMMWRDMK
jgi:hypothetical protein